MNSVHFIGNLTKDPEVRWKDDLAIANFTVAVNEYKGKEEKTNYANIVCFGKLAENCEKFLSKGRKVAVTGSLDTGSYEKGDTKVYYTRFIANGVDFLSAPEKAEPKKAEPKKDDPWGTIDDEDIPF